MRRNVYLPTPDWTRLQHLAAMEGAKRGKPVSASEMLRLLIERADE